MNGQVATGSPARSFIQRFASASPVAVFDAPAALVVIAPVVSTPADTVVLSKYLTYMLDWIPRNRKNLFKGPMRIFFNRKRACKTLVCTVPSTSVKHILIVGTPRLTFSWKLANSCTSSSPYERGTFL